MQLFTDVPYLAHAFRFMGAWCDIPVTVAPIFEAPSVFPPSNVIAVKDTQTVTGISACAALLGLVPTSAVPYAQAVAFANDVAESLAGESAPLFRLNKALVERTFLVGEMSFADILLLFAMLELRPDFLSLPGITRLTLFLQSRPEFATACVVPVAIALPKFMVVESSKKGKKTKKQPRAKKATAGPKDEASEPGIAGDERPRRTKKEKKPKKKPKVQKTVEVGEQVDLRIGIIRRVYEHPDPEVTSIWCEEIDLGFEAPKTVCSKIREYYSAEDLTGRAVMCICNLAAKNTRGVPSEAMILCTCEEDHSNVQVVEVPQDAAPGTPIAVGQLTREPIDVLKSKKWSKFSKSFACDETGIVKYGDHILTVNEVPLRGQPLRPVS